MHIYVCWRLVAERKPTCFSRGLMVCKELNQSVNADVNGAVNILNVAVDRFPVSFAQTVGTSGSGHLEMPLMLRWSYDEWR